MVRFVFTLVLAALLPQALAESQAASQAHKGPARKGGSAGTTKKSAGAATKKGAGASTKKKSGSPPAAQSAKPAAGKKSKGSARTTAKGGKKAPSKPVARGQQAPTPERITEIQKALAQRGYLKGEPSGVWGPDSSEAMKRFQQDKQLDATGKISSLSLIHLGLGPKRDMPAQQRTEQQP